MSDIVSRPYSRQGHENYDRIFRKWISPPKPDAEQEARRHVLFALAAMAGNPVTMLDGSNHPNPPPCPQPAANPEVIEMGLCEVPHIFLRPNQLYRFVVMPDCEKCAAAAAPYANET